MGRLVSSRASGPAFCSIYHCCKLLSDAAGSTPSSLGRFFHPPFLFFHPPYEAKPVGRKICRFAQAEQPVPDICDYLNLLVTNRHTRSIG
jgi:hypothetical protein